MKPGMNTMEPAPAAMVTPRHPLSCPIRLTTVSCGNRVIVTLNATIIVANAGRILRSRLVARVSASMVLARLAVMEINNAAAATIYR